MCILSLGLERGRSKMGEYAVLFYYINWIFILGLGIGAFFSELKSEPIPGFSDQVRVQNIQLQVPEKEGSSNILVRKGIVVRVAQPQATVILCHGYQSDKFRSVFFSRLFPECNAIAFDFRAHGEQAQGQFSTIGGDEAQEVFAAVHYAKQDPQMKDLPIIAYGFSMGAVAAIQAQAQKPVFDAMILDCPYDSTNSALSRSVGTGYIYNIIKKYLYSDRARPIMRFVFQHVTKFDPNQVLTKYLLVEPEKMIEKITVPVFLIRCDNDKRVPLDAIMKVYNNKKHGFKRLWLTAGRWHFDSFDFQATQYWYRVHKFVTMFLQKTLSKVEQAKIIDDRLVIEGVEHEKI